MTRSEDAFFPFFPSPSGAAMGLSLVLLLTGCGSTDPRAGAEASGPIENICKTQQDRRNQTDPEEQLDARAYGTAEELMSDSVAVGRVQIVPAPEDAVIEGIEKRIHEATVIASTPQDSPLADQIKIHTIPDNGTDETIDLLPGCEYVVFLYSDSGDDTYGLTSVTDGVFPVINGHEETSRSATFPLGNLGTDLGLDN